MGTTEKKQIDQHLGQKSMGSETYDPTLLRRIERSEERQKNKIGPVLPFYGMDIWNAFEFSFLSLTGVPVQYKLKIMYSADSKYMVESKSLKLYLNSFAMTKTENIESAVELITKDLEALLEYKVHVIPFSIHLGYSHEFIEVDISQFVDLDIKFNKYDLGIIHYTRNPELLESKKVYSIQNKDLFVKTTSLRSNCKVTNQPDYGDLYIVMGGRNLPTEASLYKYIISYRNENHFHEEIVEQIYNDLQERFQPSEMIVFAKYTRRGGIDITPLRVSHLHLLEENYLIDMVNSNKRMVQTQRQ